MEKFSGGTDTSGPTMELVLFSGLRTRSLFFREVVVFIIFPVASNHVGITTLENQNLDFRIGLENTLMQIVLMSLALSIPTAKRRPMNSLAPIMSKSLALRMPGTSGK